MAGLPKRSEWRNSNPFARKLTYEQLGLILDPTDLPETSPEGHQLYFITIVDAPAKPAENKPKEKEKELRPWSDIGSDSDSDSECDKPKSKANDSKVSAQRASGPFNRKSNLRGRFSRQHPAMLNKPRVTQTQVK